MEKWLLKCEEGDLEAWWKLNVYMTLPEDDDRFGEEHSWDLTTLPGWAAMTESQRQRVVTAGQRYVLGVLVPLSTASAERTSLDRRTDAGYRALCLLLTLRPTVLGAVPPDRWSTWAPVILSFWLPSAKKDEAVAQKLAALCYAQAPAAILNALPPLLNKDNADVGCLPTLRRLRGCHDDRLARMLLTYAQGKAIALRPGSLKDLLESLLEAAPGTGIDHAVSLLETPAGTGEEPLGPSVIAALVLLSRTPATVWSAVWRRMTADEDFTSRLFR